MPNPFDQSGESQPQQFQDKTPEEFMSELVGEGKKYATPEEAVRALAHANHHIGQLEGENATFRTQLDKAATVEDIMSKLQSGQQQPPAAAPDNTDQSDPTNKSTEQPEDIRQLVSEMLKEQQSTQTAAQNKQQVIDAMTQQFGGKAGEVWDNVEKNLGVNLDTICAQSPSAAMKLLGVGGSTGQQDNGGSFQSTTTPPPAGERPPEGSKRLVEHLLSKGEITRQQAYRMKLDFSADPAKYNS